MKYSIANGSLFVHPLHEAEERQDLVKIASSSLLGLGVVLLLLSLLLQGLV